MTHKRCSKCHRSKDMYRDYYSNAGNIRSECKACTIRRNTLRQKQLQVWKYRFVDEESRKEYAKDYYAKNKERFAAYRTDFKKKNPEYYKMYQRDRKNKKRGGG